MSVYFLDTSALVKRYVREVGSSWLTALTDLASGNKCWVASLTRVELPAALFRQARMGTLPLAQMTQAAQVFRNELLSLFQVLAVDSAILDRAVSLVEAHPLRAGDAIQLAAALSFRDQNVAQGLPPPSLISADLNLNQAARSEGMQIDDPNAHP
jgi:predicted nucleic acid-binding protein